MSLHSTYHAKAAGPGQTSPMNVTSAAILLLGAYFGAQMISDIASLKIGTFLGLAVDLGTFLYPVTFTLRDLVHKSLGKRAAQTTILAAAGVNVAMALYFAFCGWFPADAEWAAEFGDSFSRVLSPVWRIVAASIVAEIVSELVDTEVYQRLVARARGRHQWLRVLLSNVVAIPVDTLVFVAGAFAFTMPNSVVFEIFLANCILKAAVTLVSVPMIYLVHGE